MGLIAFPRKSAQNHEGPMTSPELSWLRTLEDKIEKNMKGFYELGSALAKIRENRLYRDEYRTFEEYCRTRWDFTRRHADNLIGSYKVIDNLNENRGSQIPSPTNERQTRPLRRLSAPLQKEAWQNAVKAAPDGEVTAKHVKAAVAEILDWKVRVHVKRTSEEIKTEPRVTLEFKAVYERLLQIIQDARQDKWKNLSKSAVLKHVQSLETIVRL